VKISVKSQSYWNSNIQSIIKIQIPGCYSQIKRLNTLTLKVWSTFQKSQFFVYVKSNLGGF